MQIFKIQKAFVVSNKEEIQSAIRYMRAAKGPILIEIKCNSGHRKNLGRPHRTPIENKSDFMHFLAIN